MRRKKEKRKSVEGKKRTLTAKGNFLQEERKIEHR